MKWEMRTKCWQDNINMVPWLTLRPSDDLLPTKLPLLPLLLFLILLLLTSLAVIASQIVCLRNRESRWKINYHFTREFGLLDAVTANNSRKPFYMPQSCNTVVASPHSDILLLHTWESALPWLLGGSARAALWETARPAATSPRSAVAGE
jgi:hypothetical protein